MRSLILGSLLLSAPVVCAQEDAYEADSDRFSYRIGGQFFTNFSSRFRIDSETLGLGTEVNLEEDFSLDESIQVFRGDFGFALGTRHNIAASFYDIGRDGARLTDKEVVWDGELFPSGTSVVNELDQRIIKVSYSYKFLEKPRLEMSASFGLNRLELTTGLRTEDGSISRVNDVEAPLPALGIRGAYRFTPKWRLTGSFDWLDVEVGDLQGKFLDVLLSVEHDTFENVGFGFGFNRFELDVDAGGASLRGLLFLEFDAAVFYLKGGFGSL